MFHFVPLALCSWGSASDAVAEPAAEAEVSPEVRALMALQASLTYESGDIGLGGDKVVLHVPDTFGYLDPTETDRVLQAWGNPPKKDTWGMLVPATGSVFDEAAWAVVVTYSDDGHVSDEDAAGIDYAAMLTEMQAATKASNVERRKAGYDAVTLVGWAEPPRYDPASHKIYWAKEIDFGGESHTLNYAIRVLGREGVLEFNAVGSMDQLASIRAPMEGILSFAAFTPGSRYEDYDGSTDRLAGYGIAALVTGGVAAKTGLFKGLLAMLIAGKKVVIVGVMALGAFIKSLFSKRHEGTRQPTK